MVPLHFWSYGRLEMRGLESVLVLGESDDEIFLLVSPWGDSGSILSLVSKVIAGFA
jgi:hypothetical protein